MKQKRVNRKKKETWRDTVYIERKSKTKENERKHKEKI